MALAFPTNCPIEMVGDCVKLHEVQEHPSNCGIHLQGLKPLCLVLGQDSCKILYTLDVKLVKIFNDPALNQYLKVFKPIIWDRHPFMVGYPYDVHPIHDNTLMVDDSAFKNILNPTSNFIVCPTWMVKKVQDHFFVKTSLNTFKRSWGAESPYPSS